MSVPLLFMMDKDRGYAWVILGASTILMCIGPSTYTSFGFLISDLPISPANQSWFLILLYGFWQASAILASLYAKKSPRQLATTGSALAAIGFLISASTVEDPSWFYLTFSIFIGFGLGLSFHTAYLVVMSNFERYKGLANGICQLSIAIGQITTPLLFTVVSMPKDRFQIKALTTAVGFLTTLFFVVPNHTVPRRPSTVAYRNRRYSTASERRKNSYGESVPLQVGISPVSSNSYPINQSQMRPRRRSQYLLAVSTSLLPNIPEEPESSNSINETLASTSSESDIPTLQQGLASQSVAALPHGNNDSSSAANTSIQNTGKGDAVTTPEEEEDGETSENEFQVFTLHAAVRRKSEGCLPSYVGNFSEVNNKVGNGTATVVPNDKKTENKSVAQLNRQNLESQSQLRRQSNSSIAVGKKQDNTSSKKQSTASKTGKHGESTIDLSLLLDFHFCNMAAFSALCTVSIVNFPLVLYAYVISFCEECKEEANMAVLIIYVADLISRLGISYLSDYQLLRRRTAFLIACSFAGFLVAATTLVKDIPLIYCFSVLYGLCLATLVSSEYLMFIESFGFDRFPQAYGILNIFKLIVAAALGVFVGNPLSVYLYPIHPLDLKADDRNTSLFCDPLDLFDSSLPTSSSMTRLLLNIAVPSILCAVAWIMEDIWKASHKCSEQTTKTQIVSNANNTEVP